MEKNKKTLSYQSFYQNENHNISPLCHSKMFTCVTGPGFTEAVTDPKSSEFELDPFQGTGGMGYF